MRSARATVKGRATGGGRDVLLSYRQFRLLTSGRSARCQPPALPRSRRDQHLGPPSSPPLWPHPGGPVQLERGRRPEWSRLDPQYGHAGGCGEDGAPPVLLLPAPAALCAEPSLGTPPRSPAGGHGARRRLGWPPRCARGHASGLSGPAAQHWPPPAMLLRRVVAFDGLAFLKADQQALDFRFIECDPPAASHIPQREVDTAVGEGIFSWALRHGNGSVLLHVLATRSGVIGRFVGLLPDRNACIPDASKKLVTVGRSAPVALDRHESDRHMRSSSPTEVKSSSRSPADLSPPSPPGASRWPTPAWGFPQRNCRISFSTSRRPTGRRSGSAAARHPHAAQSRCTGELARTGTEVLTLLELGRYDLILMDCMMPELDGYKITCEIRRRRAAAPGSRSWR